MLERLDALIKAEENFAFETTCAGHRQIRLLRSCRAAGYRVTLIFLWLPSARMALARVAKRVSEGGHPIPDDVIVRRHVAGLRNMRHAFLPLADVALIYDNSENPALLIAEKRSGVGLFVHDATRWLAIDEALR